MSKPRSGYVDVTDELLASIQGNNENQSKRETDRIDITDELIRDIESKRKREAGGDPGFIRNMGKLAYQGAERLVTDMPLGMSVSRGEFSEADAGRLEKALTRETYRPRELAEAEERLSAVGDDWDAADGFAEKAASLGKMLWSIGKEAATNPKGMAYFTAEQAANMVPAIAGMLGGAKLGALTGPGAVVAVPVLAYSGAVAGGMVPEMVLEVSGFVADELKKRGLDPTEQNIHALISDPEISSEIIGKTRRKALGTASVDAAFTLAGGKVAGRPLTRAMRHAEKTGTKLVRPPVSSRIAHGLAGGGVDVTGEMASEASGQLWATGEVDMGEVALEGFGGLGGAAVEVPAAARALAADQRAARKQREIDAGLKKTIDRLPEDRRKELSDTVIKTKDADGAADKANTSAEEKDIAIKVFREYALGGKMSIEQAIERKKSLMQISPDIEDELNKIIIEAEGNKAFASSPVYGESTKQENFPPDSELYDLKSSEDISRLLEVKARQFGSKRKYLESDEYRQAYPVIQAIYQFEKTQQNAHMIEAGRQALKEEGLENGHRVVTRGIEGVDGPVYGRLVFTGKKPPYVVVSMYKEHGLPKTMPWHTDWKKYAPDLNVSTRENTGLTDDEIDFILSDMLDAVRHGEGGGAKGVDDVTGDLVFRGSSYPDWFRQMVYEYPKKFKQSLTAAEVIATITNVRRGRPLADKQMGIYSDLLRVVEAESSGSGLYSELLEGYRRAKEGEKNEIKSAIERVDGGEISDVEERLVGDIQEKVGEERDTSGLTDEQEEAALAELTDFFANVSAAADEIEAPRWVRGERQENQAGDLFFSSSADVASNYGDVREITDAERPKNTLVVSGKPELAERIGYDGDPLAESLDLPKEQKFDYLAKQYAQSKGYDSIQYESGTFDEPELVVFKGANKRNAIDLEKDQANIPGASAAETFTLTNPETEVSGSLPQQPAIKNTDLFGQDDAASDYVAAIDGAINERERSKLQVQEGMKRVPGIRLQEAEEAGRWAYVVDKGVATQEQFDAWIESLEKEGRRRKPAAKAPAPEDQAGPSSKETDLSSKSTSALVGEMFDIINKHLGERGSISTKKTELDETLYQKLKPYLAEIVRRAKEKALDAKAYLFGAVDAMPDGKAKEIYEAAASRYVSEPESSKSPHPNPSRPPEGTADIPAKTTPQAEAWKDTSKWDIPEFSDQKGDSSFFSEPAIYSKSDQTYDYKRNRLDNYTPPSFGKFLTKENIDEISNIIEATKEGKIEGWEVKELLAKNLPIPGVNQFIDSGDLPNRTIRDVISSFPSEYLRKAPDSLLTKDGRKAKYLASADIGSKVLNENPHLYDYIIKEFRKNPVELYRNILKEIGYAKESEALEWEMLKSNEEQMHAFEFENSPEGRRSKFKLIKTEDEAIAPFKKVAGKVAGKIKDGAKFTRNDLFAMCDKAFGGTLAEGRYSAKDAYDALEMGVNLYISEQPSQFILHGEERYSKSRIRDLKEIAEIIPTQTTRTAEMDEFQQFSTPPHLAYVANWVANLSASDVYLEPSAGTGGLAVFGKLAGVKETIVNELAPRRGAILKALGFDRVFTENAEQLNNILPKDARPTVVVMNPPFSSTAGRIKGQRKTTNAAVHIEQALKRLQPGGRLVAIVGKGMAHDAATFKPWFEKLGQTYSIRANIGIDGREYAKYGTTFDNQILVIDKPAANKDNKGETVTGRVAKVEDLIDLLEGVRNERENTGEQSPGEPSEQKGPGGTKASDQPGTALLFADDDMGARPDRRSGRPPKKHGPGNAELETGKRDEISDNDGRAADQSSELVEGKRSGRPGPGASVNPKRSTDVDAAGLSEQDVSAEDVAGLSVEQRADIEKHSDELSDSVYDQYRPAKLSIPGAQDHPGKLVESAAMASVEPVNPTYSPKIPERAIKSGAISIAQLEAVVYAGQAHNELLPDGSRRGFFIGDGTGVGKGREIAAILWDNWNHGRRKHVWLSQNTPLLKDAERDVKGVGWDKGMLFDFGKIPLDAAVKQKEGIAFVGYGTLRSKRVKEGRQLSRLNQLVSWLGEDFDGVIVFDEAHNMGNALSVKTARGKTKASETALTGIELQRALPNARVLYVSATGATEVMNLAYAERLGLWGDRTPFPKSQDFVTSISAGGITAMEMVAMNLKASGSYMARSLAYDDITVDRLTHELTPEQRTIYDELAGAWQIVQRNIEAAMAATHVVDENGVTLNSDAKAHIRSALWGTNQRFWNQIVTAMQMPSLISSLEKDLAAGHAPIIQLVNTNEAAQERAIGRLEEDDSLEDLDITPREMLMEYINNSFPVNQYEVYEDEDGNRRSRLVVDSAGNPVLNQEAVEMRDELLNRLGSIRVPDGPLEIIMDHFGVENVAEVTGRTRRVVYKDTAEGRERVIEPWGKNKSMADADAFMEDRKKILVFSQAGGTGRSYHADNTAKNRRKRRHYVAQAGWRADSAVQGLGRSHRTNQAQAPDWILVSTDLDGQKRFISTIARRLSQLGALTRGSRDTGNQGLFSARDNLESTEAKDAWRQLIEDIYHDEVPGITMNEFVEETGMDRLIDDTTGTLNKNLPEITQFLNRILNLKIERQNALFGEFAKRLNIKVAQAIENGTLDVGVETIRAKKTEKVDESVVHEDVRTGAKATYIEVELTHDAKLLDFEGSKGYANHGYVKNVKSGRVWALATKKTRTDSRTGDVKEVYVGVGANYNYHDIPAEAVNDPERYQKIEGSAETLWNADLKAQPKEVKERVHMITGAILPVWDRLPTGAAKIYRLNVDGRNIIGRVIEDRFLADTLNRLGAQRKSAQYAPEDVFDKVLNHGFVYTLSNNWKIQRRKVAGEHRIELEGASYFSHFNELQKYGVFSERIQYITRLFIPTEKAAGVNAIAEIISSRPIVSAQGNVRKSGDVSGMDAEVMNDLGQYKVDAIRAAQNRIAGTETTGAAPMPTIDDVKKVFAGQDVTETEKGFIVKTKSGSVLIEGVGRIDVDTLSLKIGYGKSSLSEKDVIAGKYRSGLIQLVRGAGDKYTLAHESVHFMEDIGVLNSLDVAALKGRIKRLTREGKFEPQNKDDIGGAEDRAEFIAAALNQEVAPSGTVGRIIARVREFIDRIINAFGIRTAGGVIRDIKTGRIWGEKIDSKPERAYNHRHESEAKIGAEFYSLGSREGIRKHQDPPASKDPKVLNLYLKDETDAIVQTILNKLRPQNMTWLETILKSPEWMDHPQISKIVRLFVRDRNEIYHETFNELNAVAQPKTEGETVASAAQALKNKGLTLRERVTGKASKEYQKLEHFLDYFDTQYKRNPKDTLEESLAACERYMRQNGATDDVVRVWKLYRDSYDKALDIQTREMRRMIADIIAEAAEKGTSPDLDQLKDTLKGALAQMEQWRGFYAPRIREVGDWKVLAFKGDKNNREWYRDHRGSELAARRLAKNLERDGWKVYDIGRVEKLPEDVYQDTNALATAKLIDAALDRLSNKEGFGPILTAQFNRDLLAAVADEIRARGFRSHMMHRQEGRVVKGYIEDPIRRNVLYMNQIASGTAKARVARMAMAELLGEKVKGKLVGGIDPAKEPKEYEVATTYIREQLRNLDASDRVIGIAKSIATFKFLGFNLRSLAVNMTAIVTTAPASIHQYAMGGTGSMYRVYDAIGRAGKDYAAVLAGKKLANADEQAFLDDVHKKGWDDAQYTRNALGTMEKTHSRVWGTMMDASMYLFGKSEQWNRGTTMLAAYRLARKRGLDHAAAAEAAKESSDRAHGVYGRATLPMWAQGQNPAAKIGQMMYIYSKFSHNYLQMLYDLGFKKHNVKAAMFAFLSPIVVAGGAALPFKDTIFAIAGFMLRSLFGEDRDPEKWVWDTIREHLGDTAERVGRHGLTGAAGVDISGSLSIGVGIPRNMLELTGAIGGVADSAMTGGKALMRGQYSKAVENVLPTGLANPIRAAREAKEGVSTRANNRVWDERGRPLQPSAGETAARVAGFRSTRQAVLAERTWEGKRQSAHYAELRQSIYQRYRAWLLGKQDKEEHKKIVKAVREYNEKVKDLKDGEAPKITFASMRGQVSRMQKAPKAVRASLAN